MSVPMYGSAKLVQINAGLIYIFWYYFKFVSVQKNVVISHEIERPPKKSRAKIKERGT